MEKQSRYKQGRDFNTEYLECGLTVETLREWDGLCFHSPEKNIFRKLLSELVSGNTVVEIGPGKTPQRGVFQFNPKEVIYVEPSNLRDNLLLPKNARYIEEGDTKNGPHGVSYLSSIKDNSVVVFSSGVFNESILPNKDYTEELVKLIHRKTIPGGLTFHNFDFGYEKFFSDMRFNLELAVDLSVKLSSEQVFNDPRYSNLHPGRTISAFFRKPRTQ